MKPIIRVQNLSKQFRIGAAKPHYSTIRESLVEIAKKPFNSFNKNRDNQNTIWALKDIDFEITPGEVVGVIGRNGAGKSTLLKILSRITKPTTGRVELYGRVGSLLEVGTGFHNELTGRENIFLNGSILGMRRDEIFKKFDEIVDFAGIEKFLDTPVKHYSSGMAVRLAFAVAAHLEPEILIVDEVLAVGDLEFQKKCLGKMDEVTKKEGRTVLFVSHNMGAVRNLCKKGIILHNGIMDFYGRVDIAIENYLNKNAKDSNCYFQRPHDFRDKDIFFQLIEFKNLNNAIKSEFTTAEDIYLQAEIKLFSETPVNACYFFEFIDQDGRRVFSITDYLHKLEWTADKTKTVKIRIAKEFLAPQTYFLKASIVVHWAYAFDSIDQACRFTIIDNGTNMTQLQGYDYGCVFGEYEIL